MARISRRSTQTTPSSRQQAPQPVQAKRRPAAHHGVAPVPDHLAPKYTSGRYIPAAKDGTQPGYYWVNTYDLINGFCCC